MTVRKVLVLDSNVWLDWLVFDDPSVQFLKAALAEDSIEIIIDEPCLQELAHVLTYPLGRWTLDPERQKQCLEFCRRIARTVALKTARSLPLCEDSDDQKFIELAAASGAHALLTKDGELLALSRQSGLGFSIMTPDCFSEQGAA